MKGIFSLENHFWEKTKEKMRLQINLRQNTEQDMDNVILLITKVLFGIDEHQYTIEKIRLVQPNSPT